MLSHLSIRDIVLIERLDIEFKTGFSVLTGETGAGKSILLDSLSLALGARGDASLVRHGADQGQVTAVFDVPGGHPARKFLSENGFDDDGDVILRRLQMGDGRTRVFINDQAASVALLRELGKRLVEIHCWMLLAVSMLKPPLFASAIKHGATQKVHCRSIVRVSNRLSAKVTICGRQSKN